MKNSNRSIDPSNKLVDRTPLSCNQKIGMDTFKAGQGSSTESVETSLPAYLSCLIPCNNLHSLPSKCTIIRSSNLGNKIFPFFST